MSNTHSLVSNGHSTTVQPDLNIDRTALYSVKKRPSLSLRDGTELFLRDWGSGPAILFLSGWALASDMWFYQMRPLSSEGFRCIAYDRRGHGRSSDPGYGYDYDTLSEDLREVIETLDLRDLTLVTHSMAAGEAVRYLTRHGSSRVKRLVLLAPGGVPYAVKTDDNPTGTDAAAIKYYRENCILGDFAGWCDENEKPYFAPSSPPGMNNYTKNLLLRTSLQAVHDFHLAATSTDFRGELPNISVPTLILHGDIDASAPLEQCGVPTAKLIPGSRLKIYKNAPHGFYFTHKDEINDDIRSFCEEGV